MKRLLPLSGLLTLCLASAALAQTRLELKHHEGTVRTVSSSKVHQVLTLAGMDIPTDAETTATIAYTVEKPQPDGTLRVRVKTEAMVMHLKLPGITADYDSSKPDVKNDNPQIDAILDQFRAMKGVEYTLVYGKDGKASGVEGTDKILAAAPPAVAAALKQQLDPATVIRVANQELAVLPDGPVKKGEQWRRMEFTPIGGGQSLTLERFYEYQGPTKRGGKTLEKIGINTGAVSYAQDPGAQSLFKVLNSDLKVGTSLGTVLFDREAGEIVESSETLQVLGPMMFSVNGMEIPGRVDLTMETKTVYKR